MVTSRNVTCVIIGAGHAGLAMSRCLTELSVDHVLLERGEVANSWRTERWDSLRLLTPNWQSRLPGYGYEGDDPDGYRAMPETIAFPLSILCRNRCFRARPGGVFKGRMVTPDLNLFPEPLTEARLKHLT